MPFIRRPVENGRERLVCDSDGCGHEELIVEYGPLRKPKKGGKKRASSAGAQSAAPSTISATGTGTKALGMYIRPAILARLKLRAIGRQ